MSARCLWCSAPFEPRETGGTAQRFCCPAHRRAFDQAARAYVRHAIAEGRLTTSELKKVAGTSARAVTEASAPDWALAY